MADRIDPLSLGATFSLLGALCLFVLALVAWHWGWGLDLLESIARFSPGYRPTPAGSFIGAFWGAVDGFILGMVGAKLHNRVRKRGI